MIEGGCHCGNIALSLTWCGDLEAIPARRCQCTFCVAHGGVWTAHAGSALEVGIEDEAAVSRYAFGTKTATFHICARCGVVPVVTSEIDGGLYAVVNVNTLRGISEGQLRRGDADFDGEAAQDRLARRKRGWIGTVRFV